MGHQRCSSTQSFALRQLQRVVRWARQTSLPTSLRRGEEARIGLGHEEHQQPQRSHPEEELFGSIGVLCQM